jgi:hypothetical protein
MKALAVEGMKALVVEGMKALVVEGMKAEHKNFVILVSLLAVVLMVSLGFDKIVLDSAVSLEI